MPDSGHLFCCWLCLLPDRPLVMIFLSLQVLFVKLIFSEAGKPAWVRRSLPNMPIKSLTSKREPLLPKPALGSQPDELLPMALNIGAAVYTADARGVSTVTPLGDASSENVNLDSSGQDVLLMDQLSRLTLSPPKRAVSTCRETTWAQSSRKSSGTPHQAIFSDTTKAT